MNWLRTIVSDLGSWGTALVATIIGAFLAAITALIFSRRWWLVLLCVLGGALLFLVFWYLPRSFPTSEYLSEQVPSLYYHDFWLVLFVTVAVVIATSWALVRVGTSTRPRTAPAGDPAPRSEFETAWTEVLSRWDQAQIDLGRQPVCLMIGPEGDASRALVEASAAPVLARAPEAGGPILAHALPDGVLIDISGLSGFATRDAASLERLEAFCRALLAERPDCPVVKSVALVFPLGWIARAPEAAIRASVALREDLSTIQRVLGVHVPVVALISGLESLSGFAEFRDRSPRERLPRRCGFSVAATAPFAGKLVEHGLTYMVHLFHEQVLDALAADITNAQGNARLFSFHKEFRALAPHVSKVVQSALTTAREQDPIFLQGCYFACAGNEGVGPAFAAGLLRGTSGGLFAEHLTARWTEEARTADRYHVRWAIAVGALACLAAGAVWLYILRGATTSPWWGVLPALLAIVWVVATAWLAVWTHRAGREEIPAEGDQA